MHLVTISAELAAAVPFECTHGREFFPMSAVSNSWLVTTSTIWRNQA